MITEHCYCVLLMGCHPRALRRQVPLPHVSVGWLPGDQRARIDSALRRLGPTGLAAVPLGTERPGGAAPMVAGQPCADAASADREMVAGEWVGPLPTTVEVVCRWQVGGAGLGGIGWGGAWKEGLGSASYDGDVIYHGYEAAVCAFES